MQSFHGQFVRYKGTTPAGQKTIVPNAGSGSGTDTIPPTAPPGALGVEDNFIGFPVKNTSGYPAKRLALYLNGAGGTALPVFIYIWDGLSQMWMQISATGAVLNAGLNFFDFPLLQDTTVNKAGQSGGNSSAAVLVVITDTAGGIAAGAYTVSVGATLN